MTDLGTVAGNTSSCASAINSSGQIVGCHLGILAQHATLWEHGKKFDLNTLIPPNSALFLTRAYAINERGEIAGIGNPQGCLFDDLCGHAFVLIPCNNRRNDANDCKGVAAGAAAVPQPSPAYAEQNPANQSPSAGTSRAGCRTWEHWAPATMPPPPISTQADRSQDMRIPTPCRIRSQGCRRYTPSCGSPRPER
jgi:probable HAF family extracellular repeat protein